MNKQTHPLADKTVKVSFTDHPYINNQLQPSNGTFEFRIEDWWDHLTDQTWIESFLEGNPAATSYALRRGLKDPIAQINDVVYGKIDNLGYLVHKSEILS